MILKWIEDDKCFADAIVYSLKDENNKELAWLYFDADLNKWIAHFTIESNNKDITKSFREYKQDDIEGIKFRVILELQSYFNCIINLYCNYSNNISDMITEYLKKEVYNEDK